MKTDNIYSYALRSAWANNQIDFAVLCNLLNDLEEDVSHRFVEAAIGLVNPETIAASFPQKSMADTKKECTFKNYNYLQDRVYYTYPDETVRWFKSIDECDKFESGRWVNDYESEGNDVYCYRGVQKNERNSWCDPSIWMKNAIVEEA